MPDELPLFVRISATDWVEGGWDVEQSVVLARRLKELGVDLIDVSSGALVPKATIPVGKGYQVPFARRIRDEAGIMTGAVGLITEPDARQRDHHRRRRRPGLPGPRAAPRAVLGAQGRARARRRAGLADPVRLRGSKESEVRRKEPESGRGRRATESETCLCPTRRPPSTAA